MSKTSNGKKTERNSVDDNRKLVIIALLPVSVFAVVYFGWKALLLIFVSTGTAVLTEYLYERGMKKESTLSDCSAIITGLILALSLPAETPWYFAALASTFGILVVKMLFGGLGQNFLNPALAGKCFLFLLFANPMTKIFSQSAAGATALEMLHNGESVNTMDLFLGTTPGAIGETSTCFLLLGALFLIVMDVISVGISFSYIASFILFMFIFGGGAEGMNRFHYLCAQLCSGGLLLGAFFMATDGTTAPSSKTGKIIYGICLGILTGLFRVFSDTSQGVMYAILTGNLLAVLIERITAEKPLEKEAVDCEEK